MKIPRTKLGWIASLTAVSITSIVSAGIVALLPVGASYAGSRYGSKPCIRRAMIEYINEVGKIQDHLVPGSLDEAKVKKQTGWQSLINKIQNKPDEEYNLQEFPLTPVPLSRRKFELSPRLIALSPNFVLACLEPPLAVKGDKLTQPDALPPFCANLVPPSPTPWPTQSSTPASTPMPSPTPTATPAPSPGCTQTPTPTPTPSPTPTPLPSPEQAKITIAAKSVGALIMKHKTGSLEYPGGEFWGTGFMIADNIFAMACHSVQPLLREENGKYVLAPGYSLVVRFDSGYTYKSDKNEAPPLHYPVYEYPVEPEVTCAAKHGLDVALLTLKPAPSKGGSAATKQAAYSPVSEPTPVPVPDKLPIIYLDHPKLLIGDQGALIGYADLLHFVDEHAAEFYKGKYAGSKDYSKFAVLDWIAAVEHCDGLHVYLDTADTTLGESGAPMIDFFGGDSLRIPKPQAIGPFVVGIHTCCSAYFPDQDKYADGDLPDYGEVYKGSDRKDVPPTLQCASVRRTLANQDVSTHSILNDPTLCQVLKQHYVDVRDQQGNGLDISCDPLKTAPHQRALNATPIGRVPESNQDATLIR